MGDDPVTTVVTGLPRSGTSLVMQMLSAGGMPVFTDGARRPDGHNPRGYLEHDRVRSLTPANSDWLVAAEGHAVKVVVPLVLHLPDGLECDVLFVRRPMAAVLASQRRMLGGRHTGADPSALRAAFSAQILRASRALERLPSTRILYLDFDAVVTHPLEAAERIAAFCRAPLDAGAMAGVVDATLRHHTTTTPPPESTRPA